MQVREPSRKGTNVMRVATATDVHASFTDDIATGGDAHVD
jgi:hypothetical protein